MRHVFASNETQVVARYLHMGMGKLQGCDG